MKIIEENGITYIIGRNAKDNWDILDNDVLIPQDSLWFHLEDFPGAHVYILGDEIDRVPIIRAAQLTREYSKNYESSKVCYTRKDNLKKGKETGSVIFRNMSLVKYCS